MSLLISVFGFLIGLSSSTCLANYLRLEPGEHTFRFKPSQNRAYSYFVNNRMGPVEIQIVDSDEIVIRVKYQGKSGAKIDYFEHKNSPFIEVQLSRPPLFWSSSYVVQLQRDLTLNDLIQIADKEGSGVQLLPNGSVLIGGRMKISPGARVSYGKDLAVGDDPSSLGVIKVDLPRAFLKSIRIKQKNLPCPNLFEK